MNTHFGAGDVLTGLDLRAIMTPTSRVTYHLGASLDTMPSLVRFLVVVGLLTALVSGGLYVLATQFEPTQQEVAKPVPNVKIRRP